MHSYSNSTVDGTIAHCVLAATYLISKESPLLCIYWSLLICVWPLTP